MFIDLTEEGESLILNVDKIILIDSLRVLAGDDFRILTSSQMAKLKRAVGYNMYQGG